MNCIVFDMDDTLFPERAFVVSAFSEVGKYADKNWSMPGLAEQAIELFSSGQRKEIFQSSFLNLGYNPPTQKQVDELLLVYRTHQPVSLPWFPDALSIIEDLSQTHQLSLISDGFLPTQRNKAKALNVERWISRPIFTEELGRQYWKPSPKAYELVMQRYPQKKYMYVADNPSKDFIAPNALGWRTVQIRRVDGQYRDIPAAPQGQPQHIITTLEELPAFI